MVSGPYRDSDLSGGRRYKAPKALRRLQRQFTEAKKLAAYRKVFGHDPRSDNDLEMFAETYLIEMYNSGHDDLK